ncbi:MAG: proline--tRNA ligase [Candidatus Burarchaeum sp.]|nr:proline--tRNA ligase [Candidatus Burarchaeum sp.]MDO8339244.1 proline--tRNA ligase [Candidatus Burarchaeum sp.]
MLKPLQLHHSDRGSGAQQDKNGGGSKGGENGKGKFEHRKDQPPAYAPVSSRYDKNLQFALWYPAILQDAKLIDTKYPAKGFFTHMPWSVRAMKRMYSLYEAELERTGHEPAWFPAVMPESLLKKEAEHLEGFNPQVFWITQIGSSTLPKGERLALRPTSETIMYTVYSNWINGLADLPLKIYQSCQVWRAEDETKAFIRGREFYWIEAHDVFATMKEAEQQVMADIAMSEKVIHGQFGIPMLFVKRPAWDTFPGAEYTYAADTLLPDGKALQLPSTHLLGQKFSTKFDIKFTNSDGKEEYAYQTCYGPSIWRIFGALVAVHADERGLRFPFEVAPQQVVIIPIKAKTAEDDARVAQKCNELKEQLEKAGIRAIIDDSDKKPGFKYNHWELMGVPVRIELGAREAAGGNVTLVSRTEPGKITVSEDKLEAAIRDMGKRLNETLTAEADKTFNDSFITCMTIEEMRENKAHRGFFRIPYCSIANDGGECFDRLKQEFEVAVRGTKVGEDEKPPEGCMCVGGCGREAGMMVYAAKRY